MANKTSKWGSLTPSQRAAITYIIGIVALCVTVVATRGGIALPVLIGIELIGMALVLVVYARDEKATAAKAVPVRVEAQPPPTRDQ